MRSAIFNSQPLLFHLSATNNHLDACTIPRSLLVRICRRLPFHFVLNIDDDFARFLVVDDVDVLLFFFVCFSRFGWWSKRLHHHHPLHMYHRCTPFHRSSSHFPTSSRSLRVYRTPFQRHLEFPQRFFGCIFRSISKPFSKCRPLAVPASFLRRRRRHRLVVYVVRRVRRPSSLRPRPPLDEDVIIRFVSFLYPLHIENHAEETPFSSSSSLLLLLLFDGQRARSLVSFARARPSSRPRPPKTVSGT